MQGQERLLAKTRIAGRNDGEEFRVGIKKNFRGEIDSIWGKLFSYGKKHFQLNFYECK